MPISLHILRAIKEIPGFPGYFVGNDGTVWTSKIKAGNFAGQIGSAIEMMKDRPDKYGYRVVGLRNGRRQITRKVHQLVLSAFVGPMPDGMEGCHYPNSNRSNNNVDNLRWDTKAENAKDRYRDLPESDLKTCRRCGRTLNKTEFFKKPKMADGLHSFCKQCHAISSNRRLIA
jgi:hypothetical protein